jgi:hypothetical protein
MDIKVTVTPWFNTGLLWFNDNLFVVSGRKITQLDAPTGSTVSEWPVPNNIKLLVHRSAQAGGIHRVLNMAYGHISGHTATHIQLGLIQPHRSQFHHTFSQLVERTGTSPLIVSSTSL